MSAQKLTISIDEDLLTLLRALTKERRLTLSSVANELIALALASGGDIHSRVAALETRVQTLEQTPRRRWS